jgi:hypothetical protein
MSIVPTILRLGRQGWGPFAGVSPITPSSSGRDRSQRAANHTLRGMVARDFGRNNPRMVIGGTPCGVFLVARGVRLARAQS